MMFDRWCWRNEARLETQLTANLLLRWEEAKEEEERETEKENLLFFVRPFQSRRSEFFSLWKDTGREREEERWWMREEWADVMAAAAAAAASRGTEADGGDGFSYK